MFLASIFIFHYLFLIKGGILTRHSFAHYLERATTFPMKHAAGILLGLIAILVPLSIAKVNGFDIGFNVPIIIVLTRSIAISLVRQVEIY